MPDENREYLFNAEYDYVTLNDFAISYYLNFMDISSLTCFLAPLLLTAFISFSGRAIFTNVGDLT